MAERDVIHELKIWPEPYAAVATGLKEFEVRLDDRDYQVENTLWLREWDPVTQAYTDAPMLFRRVVYVHRGLGMLPGFVVLGMKAFPPAMDIEVG